MTTVTTPAPSAETARPRWYQLSPEEVATRLGVDPARGLSELEVERRRQEHGSNVLAAKETESGLQAFLRQYQDLMQIILVGAAIVNQVVTGEVGHHDRAGRPDDLQRRAGPAPGGEGGGEPGRAARRC